MEVKQIFKLVNDISKEVLGTTDLVKEDLTGLVDLGNEVFNQNAMDAYVKSLVNHIGKVVFVNRPYSGKIPSVLMDAWEFGSVLEKISADIPEAKENQSWDLVDGKSYAQDTFYKPKVSAKFFNSKVTFEVPVSITEMQVKQSFSSAEQMNGFLSMIYSAVDKSMTIKTDALVMRTINNMIGETLFADAAAFTPAAANTKAAAAVNYGSASTARCVNLLKLYNEQKGQTLTADKALTDTEFMKYASYTMALYADRMASISTLFNVGEKPRFTPREALHIVLLSDFAKSASAYLYSTTFNDEFVKLPEAETVPFWQASGKAYEFGATSKIEIKTSAGHDIAISGVLGVMFDRDALGVSNLDRRVTTNYNAKAEFFNNYYKFDAGYFNDTNENFVVFFIQ